MTKDLADATNAKILRRRSLTIGIFGAKKNKDKRNVVGVELKGLSSSEVVKVEAVVVEKFCSPLQGWPRFKRLIYHKQKRVFGLVWNLQINMIQKKHLK